MGLVGSYQNEADMLAVLCVGSTSIICVAGEVDGHTPYVLVGC